MNITQHLGFINSILGLEVVTHIANGHFGAVYLAKQGSRRVAVKLPLLKTAPNATTRVITGEYEDNLEHLKQEHEAYVRADGIACVPNHSDLQVFDPAFFHSPNGSRFCTSVTASRGFMALIRDYVPGKVMHPEQIINPDYRRSLVRTIQECHQAGMAGLDIRRDNTIVSPRGKPFLIDFGRVLFEERLTSNQMQEYREEDFRSLRKLYQPC